MDESITAVLSEYHARIRKERAERRNRPAGPLSEAERDRRLLAIGPQAGRFLYMLVRGLKAPTILELGTSYGYSGIWLGAAARESGGRLITMELSREKADHARDMAVRAGLADHIEFRVGDAVEMIGAMPHGIDFVLVDIWNDLYVPCLEAFYPKLNPGAFVVADNIGPGQHGDGGYVERVRSLPDMASMQLPIGNGLELSRFRT